MTIWKYSMMVVDLVRVGQFGVPDPESAQVRKVRFERDDIGVAYVTFWVEIENTEMPLGALVVTALATGVVYNGVERGTYLDTVFDDELGLVWHIYRLKKEGSV